MRELISIGLCCLSLGAFIGCETLSEDPIERQKQIDYYRVEALDTIALIADLILDGESLAEFEARHPKKYLIAEHIFDKAIRRLEFVDEKELADLLQNSWDKLFEEGT